jgi:hypothetical protein
MKSIIFGCFLLTAFTIANANTIVKGDLRIQDGGDVVFSDGSVQSKAQVQGPAGPANNLSIGTVETGAIGSEASATITGTTPNQALNLTIPQCPNNATAMPAVKGVTNSTTELTTSAIATAGSITVNVPGSGNVVVFISGFVSILNAGGQSSISFKVSDTANDMSYGYGYSVFSDNVSVNESISEQINIIKVFPVSSAGSKTYYLNVKGSGQHAYINPVMTALYVPASL